MTTVTRIKVRGSFIVYMRHLKGLRQRHIGQALDVSERVVGAIERGERDLSVTELSKVAAVLDCDVSDLIDPWVPSSWEVSGGYSARPVTADYTPPVGLVA